MNLPWFERFPRRVTQGVSRLRGISDGSPLWACLLIVAPTTLRVYDAVCVAGYEIQNHHICGGFLSMFLVL